MAVMSWLTKRMVRPCSRSSFMRSLHLAWKRASPTARTSSMSSISVSICEATLNARRRYMPLLYRFTGMSMNLPISLNSTMVSYLRSISERVMPRMAPFMYTFSLPVSS